MEFMLDTANLEKIQEYIDRFPIAGVTSNPTIVKKEGKIAFFEHMKKIRVIIGEGCSLHIQVVSEEFAGMMADAKTIVEKIDRNVFIKVPVTEEGIKVIKALKEQGINVTATAIYTKFQAYLAIAAKADYIAPYFNRMENLNIDAGEAIQEMKAEMVRTNSKTKILAASFKNIGQVNVALEAGAQAATLSTDIFDQGFAMPSIQKAVDDFKGDWESMYGVGATIFSL